MWKANGRTDGRTDGRTTDAYPWEKLTWPMARWAKNQSIRNKSPVAAMFAYESGRNEQSLQRTFHTCFLPSFGSFGKAVSEEKISRNRPIRNKNCLWQPCLSMDRDEMSKLYRGPSIDASYQVLVHLTKGFQRRRLKCEKLTEDRRRTTDAKWWQKFALPLARWAKKTHRNFEILTLFITPLLIFCIDLIITHTGEHFEDPFSE